MIEKLQVLWKHKAREHNLLKGSGETPTMSRKTALLKELVSMTIAM